MKHVLSFSALAVLCGSLIVGCDPGDGVSPGVPLSPARQLEGTWQNATPITFFYQTDFCGGGRETVSQALWNVRWTLTARDGFTNVLDIRMDFTRGGDAPFASNCRGGPHGWVPLISPTELTATLSSSSITASNDDGISAFGAFTQDQMMLTWVHWECLIYCFGEFTETNTLTLFRQR